MRSRKADDDLANLLQSLLAAAAQIRRSVKSRINHLRDLVTAHDPDAILRRGFSITLDAGGHALRDAAAAPTGSTLVTRLARGTVHSTVTRAE
jgi:exodeoxyribonuclease VII large subunit